MGPEIRFGADLPSSRPARCAGKLPTIVVGKPFLHAHHRFKNGKDHCYWSLVEKVRGPHDQWVQRPILYLGEINDSQKAAWIRTIEVFDTDRQAFTQLALFPLQREVPAHVTDAVQVRLAERIRRGLSACGRIMVTSSASGLCRLTTERIRYCRGKFPGPRARSGRE